MVSKKIFTSICLVVFIILHAASVASEKFVAGISDLPLLPGLHLIEESTVIFENPEGRFVHAAAKGDRTEEALWRFYEETLPHLGWGIVKRGRFIRDNEKLNIAVEYIDSQIIVRFVVTPAHKP